MDSKWVGVASEPGQLLQKYLAACGSGDPVSVAMATHSLPGLDDIPAEHIASGLLVATRADVVKWHVDRLSVAATVSVVRCLEARGCDVMKLATRNGSARLQAIYLAIHEARQRNIKPARRMEGKLT